MTIIEIIVTILLGTAAGFINTFAGGGSMLVVPFLIFIGLPANVAERNQPDCYFIAKRGIRQRL